MKRNQYKQSILTIALCSLALCSATHMQAEWFSWLSNKPSRYVLGTVGAVAALWFGYKKYQQLYGLARADLVGKDCSGTDFNGYDLTGTNFTKANLSTANFRGAYFKDAILKNADLDHADFTGATRNGSQGDSLANGEPTTNGRKDRFDEQHQDKWIYKVPVTKAWLKQQNARNVDTVIGI